jgi:integrase
MPKLSDTKIRAAKPGAKPFKLFDQDGLYLLVQPNGSRGWRVRWKQGGKEKLLALGVYPDISLLTARERRDEIRRQIANGIDPSAARKAHRISKIDSTTNTFEAVARAWHKDAARATADDAHRPWTTKHAALTMTRLEMVLPVIGKKALRDVTASDVRGIVMKIKETGKIETARRVFAIIKSVVTWGIEHERIESSPVLALQAHRLLGKQHEKHFAAIVDPKQFGALLRAIDGYPASCVVRQALRLLSLTFVRSSELRTAEWREFDLAASEPTWRIPAPKMKMRREHIVPLSRQSVAILKELQQLTFHDGTGLVFPGVRNASRPLSENTLNGALRMLGFDKDTMTAHGFRRSASTLLNEQGVNRDAIERQLAHAEQDDVRRAYNAAEYLPIRREMMQAWADYLDDLKVGGNGANIEAQRR